MKSLTGVAGKSALKKLEAEIQGKAITPAEAWSLFKDPKEKNSIKRKLMPPYQFTLTAAQVAALKLLNATLKTTLEESCNRRCSYCKRPKGHHGFSWNIEHIRAKGKNPQLTFSLGNLAYACSDCNLNKNKNLDNKKEYSFDIFHPNIDRYSENMSFFQLSTEDLHLLKYGRKTPLGQRTYETLELNLLERLESLLYLEPKMSTRNEKIEYAISSYLGTPSGSALAHLLHELKNDLYGSK